MWRSVGAAIRPWLVLALVCGGFSLHPAFLHTFWTRDYLPNILQQAATNIILAVGMTFVILTGGIDLSVGSVMALCGVALGLTVKTGPPPVLALMVAFPAGVLAALVTGATADRAGAGKAVVWAASGAAGAVVTAAAGYLI